MTLLGGLLALGERLPLPDPMSRAAIHWLVARTGKELTETPPDVTADFARAMDALPIAADTNLANRQHYEVPTEFFELVLGPQLKYSCCRFDDPLSSLAAAEERALAETVQNADIADGQKIIDLGCGWGSLSLWMARRFPCARILSVSNSHSQRAHIERQIAGEGLSNIRVVTADMNAFTTEDRFDRIVSVEMFEHMANWPELLRKIHGWLAPDGRLFIHVFAHKASPYRFSQADDGDWIGQHFFTGGLMPSHNLLRLCAGQFAVEKEWRWNGDHYRRTAEAWLANFDNNADQIGRVLDGTYGHQAALWHRRWRLFFLATAALFGFNHGDDWGVSHYRLRAR
jgi:cyclopropane-fatty-acyl-phospholipid synthase